MRTLALFSLVSLTLGCSSGPAMLSQDFGTNPGGGDASANAGDSGSTAGDAGSMPGDAGSAVDSGGIVSDLGGGDLGAQSGHKIKTVFVIVMENSNWSGIKGSTSMPYLNQTLLPMSSYATMYMNPPGLHPSEPNYLWLEAGTNFGIKADGAPSKDHQATTAHLVTQLEAAGLSWKSYQEDITAGTCPLTATKEYVPRHNPMVFFDDVTNTNDPNAARCIAHVRPFEELAADLKSGNVARYNFITPDLCNDMHGSDALAGDFTCVIGVTDLLKKGDDWLKANVPVILASQAYQTGGALFITWDEGELNTDGPIGMIVTSPFAKGGGYNNAIGYTHSSTLRTLQEIFAVSPFLGGAATSNDLSDLFQTFP